VFSQCFTNCYRQQQQQQQREAAAAAAATANWKCEKLCFIVKGNFAMRMGTNKQQQQQQLKVT